MLRRHSTNRPDVDTPIIVAGGGVAALEAVLALRAMTGRDLPITMICPEPRFVYRPLSVLEGFGATAPAALHLAGFAEEQGVGLVRARLAGVDAARRCARTDGGQELRYRALMLAIGGEPREGLPGARMFSGPADVPVLDGMIDHLEFGQSDSIAFVNPRAENWCLPLYELALLTRHRLRERGLARVGVSIVTAEDLPLISLGLDAADTAQMLLRKSGVRLHCNVAALEVRGREIVVADGEPIPADHVVTMPRVIVADLDGVPQGADGMVEIDDHAAVRGLRDVYAAGDMTAGFPNQGGVAARQAAAAARAILADLGLIEAAPPFDVKLRGVMLTPAVLERAASGERWNPPTKIAAPHLARYLGTRDPDSEHPEDWPMVGSSPFATEIALGSG
ncbi:MAG TPA: FAD-dependent oxidoreductase [Baekduia sp.]|nr:FAD-dependent oxidoreductase [Baekduia sp.]